MFQSGRRRAEAFVACDQKACRAGAGTAQAAACPGTPVVVGTTCTDTGTLTFSAGTLTLLSPVALNWAGTGNGLNQQLVDATTAHRNGL
jgi:hypothetical protein